MDTVVSKRVRFLDNPTIMFVTDDRSSRIGCWKIDADRFRKRCDNLRNLPLLLPEEEADERVFAMAIEKGEARLLSLKKRMDGVSFYRLLFSVLLNSHLFEELKSNILRNKTLLINIIDQQEKAIQGLNNLIVSRGFLRRFSPRIFQLLYLEDIIDEDNIMAWYWRKYDNERTAHLHRFGKCLITPLIYWLATAEEQ